MLDPQCPVDLKPDGETLMYLPKSSLLSSDTFALLLVQSSPRVPLRKRSVSPSLTPHSRCLRLPPTQRLPGKYLWSFTYLLKPDAEVISMRIAFPPSWSLKSLHHRTSRLLVIMCGVWIPGLGSNYWRVKIIAIYCNNWLFLLRFSAAIYCSILQG
jgi:hypothetical protein